MNRDRLEQLLLIWDEDALDPAQRSELEDALADPAARRVLREHWSLSASIGTEFIRRAERFASQRIQSSHPHPQRRSWLRAVIATAAAAIVLALAAGLYVSSTPQNQTPQIPAAREPTALARLERSEGQVRIERGGQLSPASEGSGLYGDDVLDLAGTGLARVIWPDGTVIRLHGPGRMSLSRGTGIQLSLGHGRVDVEAAHQTVSAPLGITTPEAMVTVVGTRFTLTSEGGQTRLEVIEGSVSFQRHKGLQTAVTAGEWAIATHDQDPHARRERSGKVVMIGNAPPGPPGDAAIAAHIRRLGYAVVTIDADHGRPADLTGARFVYISNSSALPSLRQRFKDVRLPLVCSEPGAAPMYGLVAGEGDTGSSMAPAGVTMQLTPGNPLIAGQPVELTLLQGPARLGWFLNAPAGAVVASDQRDPSLARILAYEAGTSLANGQPAPARRVGLFLNAEAGLELTDAGWKVIEALVIWVDTPPAW
jgi:ferric-dicitrate binding protein FerR (iron transport regulator)